MTLARCWPLLALTLGCATLDPDDTLWLVPPLSPAERAVAEPGGQVAALGTFVAPRPGPRWTPRTGALRIEHVLTSLSEVFPLIAAARLDPQRAEARQLAALGAYDLKLKADATWSPRGFYEHHTAKAGLEQDTGLWGLKVYGGYRLGVGDFDPTFDGKRVTNHGGEFSGGARLPLLQGGAIDADRADLLAAELERGVAAEELAATLLAYELEATSAYWGWVAAGRALEIAERLVALAETRQAAVRARVARGDLPPIEAIDNDRLVVRRRTTQIKAERELQKRAIKLSLFLRDAEGRPLRPGRDALPAVRPSLLAPDPQRLVLDLERAQRIRPELRLLAQRRERAELRIREAENQLLPELDVFVEASQDLDRSQPSPTKGEFELTAGLSFGYPLQNRKARGTLAARTVERDQLIQRERYQRDAIEAEVRDAFSELATAYDRVDQARQAADLARQVAAAEQRRFELGDSTVLQLNLREAATAEAELQEISARVDYWSAVAGYRIAIGQRGLPAAP